MVEAGGVEPRASVESAQVIDSMKRLKRQNVSKRPFWLRSGYAGTLEKVRAQKTLLPIHQHARGRNDEGYQEIEKDFGSQAKSERLGKQHVQLISNRQHTTDNSSKQAISLENSRAEHKAQGARQ